MKFLSMPEKSGHWYREDGKSAHGATLREARRENLYPSVTTVLSLIASPGLDAWKRSEAILAALTLPKIEGESDQDFAARVAIDMEETGSKAAKIGTNIHDWAEKYCLGEYATYPEGYETVCYKVQEWIDTNLDKTRIYPEQAMVNKELGYAGKIDLQGYTKDGRFFILDFKSQGIKPGKNAVFYPKWIQQLAAYAEGKVQNLCNLAISTNPDNPIIAEKWWTKEEIETGWEIFKHCLAIWQLERGYKPV